MEPIRFCQVERAASEACGPRSPIVEKGIPTFGYHAAASAKRP